jgi:serine/threonine-protein kinase
MKRLFAGGDVPTLLRLVQQTPPRMTTVRPDIPPALDDAVAGALERSHGARTPTAAAFARALAEACGSVVRIAELDEVAAYVAAAAGPKLLDRKRQIQSIMRLRQAIDAVAEASIAANPGGTTGYTGGEIVVSAEGDTGTGTSTVSEKTPTVAEHSSPTAVTDTTSSAELRRALPRRPWWRAIAAVGAIAVALVGVASWALRTPKPTPVASAAAAAKPAASLATPPPEPTADPTPEPTAAPPPVAASLDSVDVHANAPVSSLTLNGRVIALAVPSNEVTLERSDAEKSGAVRVVAVAVDGRRATTTLAADASALEIRFTGRSAPTAPPPSTGRTRLTLAPSPYSR